MFMVVLTLHMESKNEESYNHTEASYAAICFIDKYYGPAASRPVKSYEYVKDVPHSTEKDTPLRVRLVLMQGVG